MKALFNWLDDRTGYRGWLRAALYEHIPGGSRWRYVWGSTLVFTFVVQIVTGIFLWMAYSPSAITAWESVYYIQYEMPGGWLLRGIHHYTAQVMIVLLALHLLQVVIDGAYRAPREFNFWTGLILLQIVMGLGLTGYLLPWDQKGYWATKVATSIVGLTPGVGTELQRLVVGGSEYGHHTLTRFFALHAGVLPGMMILFIGVHIYFFRRKGIHAASPRAARDDKFWPNQVLKDAVACLAVLAVVLILVVQHRIADPQGGELGAPLFAPAEPAEPFASARPEWYFLFLFQFLKFFPGEAEVWGAIYIPGMVLGVMALMPILGRWRLGHRFNVVFVFALLAGAGVLTAAAIIEDSKKDEFHEALADAERNAERIRELAQSPTKIPPTGAAGLLRNDPYTQGPKLFKMYCASCHRYDGHDGTGKQPKDPASGADLRGFASREWLTGFFDPARIDTSHYFGGTSFADGTMSEWVKDNVSEFDDEEKEKLAAVIKALSAEARLKSQRQADVSDRDEIARGRGYLLRRNESGERGLNCTRCHTIGDEGRQRGPDLTGYGSREWLLDFIADPAHERFYGENNDRMPSFANQPIPDHRSIELIVDWLRGEWFVLGEEPWEPPEAEGATGDGEDGAASPPVDAGDGSPAPANDEGGANVDPQENGTDENEADGNDADGTANEDAGAGAEASEDDSVDASAGADSTRTVEFARDVQPVLERSCAKCHGGSKRKPKGEYNLTTKDLAFTAGDFGEPPIVPGKKAASYLYQLITAEDEDERMPPEGRAPPLSAEEIARIGVWIDSGAAWPDGVELTAREEESEEEG